MRTKILAWTTGICTIGGAVGAVFFWTRPEPVRWAFGIFVVLLLLGLCVAAAWLHKALLRRDRRDLTGECRLLGKVVADDRAVCRIGNTTIMAAEAVGSAMAGSADEAARHIHAVLANAYNEMIREIVHAPRSLKQHLGHLVGNVAGIRVYLLNILRQSDHLGLTDDIGRQADEIDAKLEAVVLELSAAHGLTDADAIREAVVKAAEEMRVLIEKAWGLHGVFETRHVEAIARYQREHDALLSVWPCSLVADRAPRHGPT